MFCNQQPEMKEEQPQTICLKMCPFVLHESKARQPWLTPHKLLGGKKSLRRRRFNHSHLKKKKKKKKPDCNMNCHYSLGCLACQVCNNAGVRERHKGTPNKDSSLYTTLSTGSSPVSPRCSLTPARYEQPIWGQWLTECLAEIRMRHNLRTDSAQKIILRADVWGESRNAMPQHS